MPPKLVPAIQCGLKEVSVHTMMSLYQHISSTTKITGVYSPTPQSFPVRLHFILKRTPYTPHVKIFPHFQPLSPKPETPALPPIPQPNRRWCGCAKETLHLKPETRNPKPETQKPKAETPNPKPQTITLNPLSFFPRLRARVEGQQPHTPHCLLQTLIPKP